MINKMFSSRGMDSSEQARQAGGNCGMEGCGVEMHGATVERLFACSLGFRRTLKIVSRTLSDVANRVRLCGHHTRRRSRGEVQS